MSEAAATESLPLPRTFILELTRRCNNACLYCYTAWSAPELGYPRRPARPMSAAEIREVVSRLQDDAPVRYMALSGGEPLLRDDLPEIVTFLRSRDIAPAIITNGTLLSRERVAATAGQASYEVTLLSYRPEVHDRMVGRSGAWDAAVHGMANVTQAGGSFVAAFIATRLNYRDLPTTLELITALGARALMYNRINLAAHNLRRADELLPTPAMIEENLAVLDDFSARYQLFVSASVVIEPCVIDVRKYQHIHFGWCPLAGKDSYFTIDPAGNLRICNHSPVVLGNLKRDRFADIYANHPHVRSFRETWPVECADCEPELKALCRGGCRAAAEQCYGTHARVDPFVTLSRDRRWLPAATRPTDPIG